MIAVGGRDEPPPPLRLQVMLAHDAADLLGVDDDPLMPQLGADPPITVTFELLADRRDPRDDLGVVGLDGWGVVESGAWQTHQTASFADGEATGPVITDVVALLARSAFLDAPFRKSISSACRPTRRSRAAIFASYSWRRSAAWASSSKAPASYFATQTRIRLREMSWRLAS